MMSGIRSGAHVSALAIVTMSGCAANLADQLENAFEELDLDEPFEAELEVDGVERSSIRAGLFAATSTAEITAEDGTTSSADVDLDADWTAAGRIDAYLPSGASSASMEPLSPASIDGDSVVFSLPDLSIDTELVAVVWFDDDGDGALDVGAESSEAARTIVRDHEGTPHYLSYYSYDATEETYSATAVGDMNGTANNLILSRDQLDGWSVTIDRATDEPD